jgi:hypothetical protein
MKTPRSRRRWFRCRAAALLITGSILAGTCDSASSVDPRPDELAVGTWGGDNVGLVADESVTHVHVGCTYGDFPARIELDDDLRFSVPGEYLLRAYPVALGPPMPAQLAGVLRGNDLTLTVAVNDTIERKLVVLGPVTVTFGRDPRMGPCPICERPGDRSESR